MPGPPSESPGQLPSLRRSFTLPAKLSPQAPRDAPALSENVIFYHPKAKIVKFAPRAVHPSPSSSAPSDFDYPVDTIETLPWRSATERTVATAPLRLEKVHGLTVFLKCGNVVHAILKNSQCWCVDGVSKFVLRIRPLTYYRIELPHETEEDHRAVGDLKNALPTVLRYEVTPCPFKRAFTVEIPEEAMAPRRKKAWRPKARRESAPANSLGTPDSLSPTKSDGVDSTSTGDDTDGNATDDSDPTSNKANSTALETIPDGDESSLSTDSMDPPIAPAPPRRSVTETTQTFTSLLAKFEATSVHEEDSDSDRRPDAEALQAADEAEAQPELEALFGTEAFGDAEASSNAEGSSQAETIAEIQNAEALPENQPSSCSGALPLSEDAEALPEAKEVKESSEAPAQYGAQPEDQKSPVTKTLPEAEEFDALPEAKEAQALPEVEAKASPVVETVAEAEEAKELTEVEPFSATEAKPEAFPEGELPEVEGLPDTGVATESDASLSSSPASFHSADLLSPADTNSTHASPVEFCGLTEKIIKCHDHIISQAASQDQVPPKIVRKRQPEKLESSKSEDILATPPMRVQRIVKEDPPRPTSDLSVSSSSRLSAGSVISSTAPHTDFNHMSAEFRRRARATRQRDLSPMPPPSTIYHPPPTQDATSILTKALTMVLIPPMYLFVILLHVAARIVANPAVDSTSKAGQPPRPDYVNEDDFSFPLEPETPSEYEDANLSSKMDPWDLD
ncbi:Inheritance of peroxisomes protein 1 [Penicillium lagena]|uniref:Inheritance of peroxisomes protein 1 n=1 Tax=Penicillium lagena TaxID=94218 RepID=UPI00253F6AC5|nr:Inheritance of peroxisomes protein 1 [Penicillium lagena]KAJ5624064.1 Inheritance of peroxisomes protein 1 [Penicillium lagena]